MSSSLLQTGKLLRSEFLLQKNRIKVKKLSKKKDSGKETAANPSEPVPESAKEEIRQEVRTASKEAWEKKQPLKKQEEGVPQISLAEAVIWSEILGDPISVRRRKKRMERFYGNQGYAGRR